MTTKEVTRRREQWFKTLARYSGPWSSAPKKAAQYDVSKELQNSAMTTVERSRFFQKSSQQQRCVLTLTQMLD